MKSVVICGSSRFADGIFALGKELKERGVVVYEPHLYRASGGVWENLSEADSILVASGLTHDHFYKIRMADVVFVYNEGGYSGVSTSMEIAYAVACNKPIYALSDKDEELARKVLFSGYVGSAEELIKYL